MKLSRRMAMGTMVGGAVSGGEIINQDKEQLTRKNYPKAMPNVSSQQYLPNEISPEEILKERVNDYYSRLKSLTKLANGDFSELYRGQEIENEIESHVYYMRSHHINSLKSVSEAAKMQIEHRTKLRHKKKEWIENAKKELKELIFPTLENQNDRKIGQP